MPEINLEYPAGLPGPKNAPFNPVENRQLSSLPGPLNARPMQRDRRAFQPVEFTFTHAELDVFEAWLEDPLVLAGAWFAAPWPQPQGGVGVRRFVGRPSYPVVFPGVGWRVSAVVEVRGRGELPTTNVSNCVEAMQLLDVARSEASLVFQWWNSDPSPPPVGLVGSYVSVVRDPGDGDPGSSFPLRHTVAWDDLADLPTVNLFNLIRDGSGSSDCSYVIDVTDAPANQGTVCKACICQTTGHWTDLGGLGNKLNGFVTLNGEPLGFSDYVPDSVSVGFLLGNLLVRNTAGVITGGLD